jgi:hypothetical protein
MSNQPIPAEMAPGGRESKTAVTRDWLIGGLAFDLLLLDLDTASKRRRVSPGCTTEGPCRPLW